MSVIAYDTETYKGYVKLLANSQGQYLETSNTLELLNFLNRTSCTSGYNVFFNIEYDLGSIIKEHIVSQGDRLHSDFYKTINAKAMIGIDDEDELGYRFDIEDYHIVYLSGKTFSLKKGNQKTKHFWDVSNFYKLGYGFSTLDYCSRTYLNDRKNDEELSIDRAKIGNEHGYYEKYRDKIIRYCIKDCDLTKRLFLRTKKGYENLGFVFPEKPYSPASVFKEFLKDKWNEEIKTAEYLQAHPSFSTIYNAYRGGIFQTFAIGHYENVYDIDINSAYPYYMASLPSVVDFKLVENIGNYNFYRVKGFPDSFTPLRSKNKNLIYGNSSHKWTFYKTLEELKEDDEILEEVHIKTDNKPILPIINQWYNQKSDLKNRYGKDSVEYDNLKRMINGGYGVFAQSVPDFTKYTNYVYASYMTSLTRVRIKNLYDSITQNGDKVISISTDGITIQNTSGNNLEYLKGQFGNDMGQLSVNKWDSITQYLNGIYVLQSGWKQILKKRGFERMRLSDLNSTDYQISYESYKPMRLMSAIIQKRYNELNDFSKQTKIFSPYESWLRVNPKMSEKILDWTIADFKDKQLDVPKLYIDNYLYLLGDNQI